MTSEILHLLPITLVQGQGWRSWNPGGQSPNPLAPNLLDQGAGPVPSMGQDREVN